MERKGECNLAVTQILHLHLYKTSSPVCLSGSLSLFLFPSFLSFSLPLSLPFLSMCCGLGRCHFRHVFSTLCTLCVCVNCSHPWGKRERWVGPVWELPCQVLWYDSAWSCRHLVCLKGTRKARLLSLFSLLLPSLHFLFDLSLFLSSLSLSHILSLSSLSSNSEKTAALQPAHRHPPLPAQSIPSIMAHCLPLLVWMQVC